MGGTADAPGQCVKLAKEYTHGFDIGMLRLGAKLLARRQTIVVLEKIYGTFPFKVGIEHQKLAGTADRNCPTNKMSSRTLGWGLEE